MEKLTASRVSPLARGILEVPLAAASTGPGGYYETFARRATGLIMWVVRVSGASEAADTQTVRRFGKWLTDVVLAVAGAFSSRRR